MQQLLQQITPDEELDESIQAILRNEAYAPGFPWEQMQAVLVMLVGWIDGAYANYTRTTGADLERFVEIVMPFLRTGKTTEWRVKVIDYVLARRKNLVADLTARSE